MANRILVLVLGFLAVLEIAMTLEKRECYIKPRRKKFIIPKKPEFVAADARDEQSCTKSCDGYKGCTFGFFSDKRKCFLYMEPYIYIKNNMGKEKCIAECTTRTDCEAMTYLAVSSLNAETCTLYSSKDEKVMDVLDSYYASSGWKIC